MIRRSRATCFVLLLVASLPSARAADWTGFRGPGGMGVSDEKNVPLKWSAGENIAWKTPLPGPGASCPITTGNRVIVTCYSGYGVDEANPGDQKNLRRHLLCFNRANGNVLWQKEFEPKLPEHAYQGEGSYQGYAASTPATDGERLYVFFGKSGVYCFDLEGKEIWHKSVGEGINGWGSGASPVLYDKFVIINASVESGALVAFDRRDGSEKWRAPGIRSAWDTPLVVPGKERRELVISIEGRMLGFDPNDGKPLWNADGVHRYVCPSVVAHDGTVYAIGGGHTSLAVRTGGSGDVTASNEIWRQNKGSNVGSPIYLDGHVYWVNDGDGTVCCQKAATGETVFQKRPQPDPGQVWSSPVLADGNLYIVSRRKGTYVVAAKPAFEQLAHNAFADDDSRTNASPSVSNGQIFLRNDRFLYCIGKK